MNEKQIKWHQLTAADAVRQTRSDAALGLSSKKARARLRKNGPNTLFDPTGVYFHAWKQLLLDPSMLLLFFAILLCFVFSEIGVGILSLILFSGTLLFCAYMIQRAKRTSANISAYRIPTVRVLRDGKIYVISARRVVCGDVLLLRAGDIVPCDCRLLSCDAGFRILTVYSDRSGKTVKKLLPKDAATVYPYKAQQFAPFFENMLYGSSEILNGEACALAVETGYHSFCGAMALYCGTGQRNHSDHFANAVSPILRLYSLISLLVILPLCIVGIFTAPKDQSLLRILTPACALIAMGSRGFLTLLFRLIPRYAAEQVFSASPEENRAILKGADADERLASMTDLIVLGRFASSDGQPHLFRCAIGTGEVSVKGDHPELRAITEAYRILTHHMTSSVSLGNRLQEDGSDDRITCEELEQICKIDTKALNIRIKSAELIAKSDGNRILDVRTMEAGYRLIFSEGEGMLHHCTGYESASGRILPLASEQQTALSDFAKNAIAEGCRIVTVIKQAYSRSYLVGVLALREEFQAILPSALEEIKQCGVHVSFFLEENTRESLAYAAAAGLPRAVAPDRTLPKEDAELLRYYAKYRVYHGIAREEIKTLVQTLRRAGRRVAVLGNAIEDLPILSEASFTIACDPLRYHDKAVEAKAYEHLSPDGRQNSSRACQIVRKDADLLICRAGRLAGGIPAILQALSYTRTTAQHAKLLLRHLVCSHLMRWIFSILSFLSGSGLMNTVQMLLCGSVFDLLAFIWILHLPILQSRLRRKTMFDRESVLKNLSDRSLYFAPLFFSLFMGVVTILLGAFGVIGNAVAVSVLFCSLLLAQTLLLYVSAFRSGRPILGRIWLLPLALLLFVALLLLASVLHAGVAKITEIGAWNLWGILLTLFSPLPLLLFTSLFSRIRRSSSK